jgi:hypothetical protein
VTLHQLKKGPNKGKGQIRDGKKLILECETYYEALIEFRELRKAND